MKKPRKPKPRIAGIGGVFFKARNPEKLGAWYRTHLGLAIEGEWTGCAFPWRDPERPSRKCTTVWGVFASDTDYFGPGPQQHMLNYRVGNLKRVLAQLKREGVWVDSKTETSEFGKFGWIKDGEGNRIELWEPPKGM